MPGDQVSAQAYAKYMNLSAAPNTNPLITSLAAAFGVSSSSNSEQLKIYNGLNSFAATVPAGDHVNDDEGAPKVFITILFFDKNYNLMDAAWDQVTTTGAQTSTTVKQPPHDELSIAAVAKEAGYAYIFVSNEHPTFVDVYIDDVTVSLVPSAIVSVSDYYPFGLTFNSYQRENSVDQDYKFNGFENEDELGLNVYSSFFRMHDPILGRWWQIDPKPNEMLSGYAAMNNNPILYSDPLGDTTRIYSTQGKLLNTINDSHENQVHFVNKNQYSKMEQGEKESTNDYASRVRGSSVAFMGANTIADMKAIAEESTNINKEIAFVGSISESREIRLSKLSVDENNGYDYVKVRLQLDSKYSNEQQGKLFLMGHIHHDGFVRNIPLTQAQKLWNLGKPTDPDDYQPQLRGANGQLRQTPAIIGTTAGFSVYGTGSRTTYNGYRPVDSVDPGGRISYSFYKQSKGKR